MTDEQIARVAECVIQRLQPPLLVLVSSTAGYRQAIRRRLAGCGHPLHLALETDLTDASAWQAIGEVLSPDAWQDPLPPVAYRALLLPFLDYPLAVELANGALHSPFARRVHEALLRGMPVLALGYHCDPSSELNQLLGAQPETARAGQMQATLARLGECGITLCTMNELLAQLAPQGNGMIPAGNVRRYITVSDVVNNPALAGAPDVQFTDAAADFLKNKKRTLPYQ